MYGGGEGAAVAVKAEQHPASQHYGSNWTLPVTQYSGADGDHITATSDRIQIILLQEIRDELQRLNALLSCVNFTGLPKVLKRIDKRLATRILLNGERPKARRRKGATDARG